MLNERHQLKRNYKTCTLANTKQINKQCRQFFFVKIFGVLYNKLSFFGNTYGASSLPTLAHSLCYVAWFCDSFRLWCETNRHPLPFKGNFLITERPLERSSLNLRQKKRLGWRRWLPGVCIRQESFVQNDIFWSRFEVLSARAFLFPNCFYIFLSNTNTLLKSAFRKISAFPRLWNMPKSIQKYYQIYIFCFFVRHFVSPILKHFIIRLCRWNFACIFPTFPSFFVEKYLKKWCLFS